ncbi:hypothetical protein DPMN_145326 [Dreissena polymorpha]|uniref:Uncharacterized protein n=1 Tax=Dreissena polymorpha TaxID=45954 RepID=A0A9D4F5S8_DREPO|nr:hypothetical protein DPMN_145326 [Dreissena polymorpha]
MADINIPNARRPRQFRRIDRFTETNDPEEIRRRFRLTPHNIDRIERLVGHRLETNGTESTIDTVAANINNIENFCFRQFFASNRDTFGVDITTVSRVVTRVTDELCDLKKTKI